MPRPDQTHPSNAAGPWFVDTHCIRCDAARNWAPDLIGMDTEDRSFLITQPVGVEQEAELWRAAAACPTKSIGNREPAPGAGGDIPLPDDRWRVRARQQCQIFLRRPLISGGAPRREPDD